MNKIWVSRLTAGTQKWSAVPSARKDAVLALLRLQLTEDEVNKILNEGIDMDGES